MNRWSFVLALTLIAGPHLRASTVCTDETGNRAPCHSLPICAVKDYQAHYRVGVMDKKIITEKIPYPKPTKPLFDQLRQLDAEGKCLFIGYKY